MTPGADRATQPGPTWLAVPGTFFTRAMLKARVLSVPPPEAPPASGVVPMQRLATIDGAAAAADHLNSERLHKPKWLRRLMRKQGRINRKLREGTELLLNALQAPGETPHPVLASARGHFESTFRCNRGRKLHPVLQRIVRRQGAFNNALNASLGALAQHVRASLFSDAEPGPNALEHLGHLDWHLAEAAHLNAIHSRGPFRWLARPRRDQYMINRCHIVALKKMCALLAHK